MTDREPGAPDGELPADDTYGDLFQDDPPADESTDADAENGDGAEADETEELDEAADEAAYDADAEDEADDEAAGAAAVAVGGSRITSKTETRGAVPAGQSVAERAVHLTDRASAIFVVAVVLTFVGILLYGMLAGSAGFFTPLATPAPTPTEAPIPSESAQPSAEPSSAPSASPSGSPGASGSGAPSGSPTSPSAAPSTAAPSGSPSAPSASPSPKAS
jgi:hypothetical protein